MARRFRRAQAYFAVLAVVFLLASSHPSPAATAPTETPEPPPNGAQVWLGQSIVPLNGPWRFTLGDSPVDPATHQLLWAQPGFDDSQWETVDLAPKPGWSDPYNGDPRYVPGWTATGHPGYIGWAWYRLRAPIAPAQGTQLALSSSIYVDDGYQVFANGVLIGHAGIFSDTGKEPIVYATGPAMFALPSPKTAPSAPGPYSQVIAFRVWMGPMGFSHSPYAGGLHYAPYLGEASAISAQTKLAWTEIALQSSFAPLEGIILLLFGCVAAGLTLFDRSDRVYLWLAAVLWFTALSDAALTIFNLTQLLSLKTYFMYFDVFSNPIELCGWIMVWWFWFHLQSHKRVPKIIAALAILYMISKAIGGDFFYSAISPQVASVFNVTSVGVRLLFLPVLIYIVWLGIRKQGAEGWFVLPAVIPLIVSQFASELIVLDLPVKWAPFGVTIFVGQVSNLISAAAISLLLLRRLQLTVRQQKEYALDLKQAQEMQRMLIPEQMFELPGFLLTSAYRPVLEVGGDFFQIVPNEDGSVAIVMGDVSGKGLKAAMAVSLIMGTIRILADECKGPADFLYQLNRRLMGRLQGGFATCLALWIRSDGSCVIAGAGHPSPYFNDQEISVAGALPLALDAAGIYEEKKFNMREGDCLTLYTDGLPEARNQSGELYGFPRLKSLIEKRPNAQHLADVARSFGQHDDVTVLTLTRLTPREKASSVTTTAVVAS